jgi:hypothetical protein
MNDDDSSIRRDAKDNFVEVKIQIAQAISIYLQKYFEGVSPFRR